MSPAQHRAYRAEVAKWQKACADLGRPCDDEARRASSTRNFVNLLAS